MTPSPWLERGKTGCSCLALILLALGTVAALVVAVHFVIKFW